jgi:4a-hydroxytetrahydrobiopterin dehydratase
MAGSKLKALSDAEIRKRLTSVPEWSLSRGAIRRRFRFPDFARALEFVVAVGRLAEKANHHPDIDIRYSLVRLALSTHDVSGITSKDLALAQAIDGRFDRAKSV